MKLKLAAITFSTVFLLVGPAFALTLSNGDEVTYGVTVITGQGDGTVETFDLESGFSMENLCEETGCTIRLSNGVEKEFKGDEDVEIIDGQFALNN